MIADFDGLAGVSELSDSRESVSDILCNLYSRSDSNEASRCNVREGHLQSRCYT